MRFQDKRGHDKWSISVTKMGDMKSFSLESVVNLHKSYFVMQDIFTFGMQANDKVFTVLITITFLLINNNK